jgi:hypothetical protein
MSDTEKNIEKLEGLFAELSGSAVNKAYNEALKSGLSVYISSHAEGGIFEVFPGGEKRLVKRLEPPFKVTAGTTVEIPK